MHGIRLRSLLYMAGNLLIVGLLSIAPPDLARAGSAAMERPSLDGVKIDWSPLEPYFEISNVHLGKYDWTNDRRIESSNDAIVFLLQVKPPFSFTWAFMYVPQVYFYDAADVELGKADIAFVHPGRSLGAAVQPGERLHAYILIKGVNWPQVKTIRVKLNW